MDSLVRCGWASSDDQLYLEYHDKEWGVPLHDDQRLFEFLSLEGFQAGLSWATILRKRENFRKSFKNFDPRLVARFDAGKARSLKNDAGIVRNESKIGATIQNANAFLEIQREFGSFDSFVWGFVEGGPKINRWHTMRDIPARTKESDALSLALKERGFKFVGSTICYPHMQATGMVNDHLVSCFRYEQLVENAV